MIMNSGVLLCPTMQIYCRCTSREKGTTRAEFGELLSYVLSEQDISKHDSQVERYPDEQGGPLLKGIQSLCYRAIIISYCPSFLFLHLQRSRPDEGDDVAGDNDDDMSLVSRSPSPDNMDVDAPESITKYDEYHRGVEREVITVDTRIKPTNKGFTMLAKLGWVEGQPLGLSADGKNSLLQALHLAQRSCFFSVPFFFFLPRPR